MIKDLLNDVEYLGSHLRGVDKIYLYHFIFFSLSQRRIISIAQIHLML